MSIDNLIFATLVKNISMGRLRLKHSSTPARLYDLDNWNQFGHHGYLNLQFIYNGQPKNFTIGYTKPYNDIENGIFAKLINLNQFGTKGEKLAFNEWQNYITQNGIVEIDIWEFQYDIISIL
ncbi:hypothetical protein [Aquirufa ecclesiirivi]|uniref:hypothetical protein n=1 Tax=Aquirufa ecclesiirivi TaxID=2715124 RepID=UPI0023D8913B|nr:hypothetical protein [Aquirufa ecclesiirivi]MDF0692690.1 hypothetical protein [Aquirufa ecclesiirivi]